MHDDTENTVELPLHDMELKSLCRVMVNAYFLTKPNQSEKRNRHAIYHFFNPNSRNGVISMSPNIFYKNLVLKNGSGYSDAVKRRRMLNLVGGKPTRLYFMLSHVIENRKNENLSRKSSNYKSAHAGQLNFYRRLYRLLNKAPIGNIVKVDHGTRTRIPNANLVRKLQNYYREVTLGRNYRSVPARIRNINTNIRRITNASRR
jgi:hypothetical protein